MGVDITWITHEWRMARQLLRHAHQRTPGEAVLSMTRLHYCRTPLQPKSAPTWKRTKTQSVGWV